MSLLSVRREVGEFRKRYKWMALGVVVVFSVLIGRMVQLQVVEHDHYASIARENITKTLTLPATRGIVRDRAGRIVVTNRPSYDVYLTPSRLARGRRRPGVADLMGLDAEGRADLDRAPRERAASTGARTRSASSRTCARDQLAALETHERDLPAIDVVVVARPDLPVRHARRARDRLPQRAHGRGARRAAAGRLSRSAIGSAARGSSARGRASCAGRRGFRRVSVDARGRVMERVLIEDDRPMLVDPVPGRDLTLTLDMELMRIVERAFRGHPSGARGRRRRAHRRGARALLQALATT